MSYVTGIKANMIGYFISLPIFGLAFVTLKTFFEIVVGF